MSVRIKKIAPEEEAIDFVIKTQCVVANADGSRSIEPLPDQIRKFTFANAFFCTALRRNAGQQTAFRIGQLIIRWATVENFTSIVRKGRQIESCASPGELRRSVLAWIDAKSFIVIPIKGWLDRLGAHRRLSHDAVLLIFKR